MDRLERPFDVWHSLLERENAFVDDFLEISFQAAEHITFIASANDVSDLPSSILDRLLVIEVSRPNREQLEVIVAGLYEACRGRYGGVLPERLGNDFRDALARYNPRRIGRLLELAVGYAIGGGRRRLTIDDVLRADRLAGEPPADRRGFRGQVGFTRDQRTV